jgi:outer membrane protein W
MRKAIRGALAATILGATCASVQAADLGALKGPPPAPPIVDTYQPFQVRIRATGVIPDTGGLTLYDKISGNVTGINTLTGLGLSASPFGTVPGASSTISWSVIPELDISYYFNKNFAVEAICCLSYHSVQGTGIIREAGIARTWVFPPSLIFQYHFTNFGAFQPYIGVGVNFTTYFGVKTQGNYFPLYARPGAPLFGAVGGYVPAQIYTTSISPSWGVVGQIGFDYMLNEHWGVNVDLKRIQMESNAQTSFFTPVAGGIYVPTSAKVRVNPWVVGAGVTYRFGGGWNLPAWLPRF